jgi:hypothetical protein
MVSLVMTTLAQRPPKVPANPLKSKVAEIERRVPQQPNLGDRPFLHPLLSFSFQLVLEVIQEAPVGPLVDDLLRVGLGRSLFMQAQGIEADGVLGAVHAPFAVGGALAFT